MSEVTRILCSLPQGNSQRADQLLAVVYEELRKLACVRMADETAEHTTALVHERCG